MPHVLAEPVSLPSSTLWARFVDAAASFRASVVGRRRLSEAEALLFGAAERHAAFVLDAHDVADLHQRVFTVAQDPHFLQVEFDVAQVTNARRLPRGGAIEVAFREAFGDTRLARECAQLLGARVDALAQVPELVKAVTGPNMPADLLPRVLSDFRTPPVIASLLVASLGCEVATLALVAPLMDAGRWVCPPWLRLALMELVRSGAQAHLKLLALAPGVTVPLSLLPLEERLDAAELQRESDERARFVLPPRLLVEPAHAQRLVELLEMDGEPSDGVRALFSA
jgi:hypothetical protein